MSETFNNPIGPRPPRDSRGSPEGEEASHPRAEPGSRTETLLARALWEYQDRSARGDSPSREEFLGEHPEISRELRAEIDALYGLEHYLGERPPSQRFGDFEVIAEAGRGAMGIVYEARQISLDRRVALKILPPNFASDAMSVERFRREARVAGRLSHPNIVSVYAMGIQEGTLYYAMEYAEGTTLGRLIRHMRLRYGTAGLLSEIAEDDGRRIDTEGLPAWIRGDIEGLEDLEVAEGGDAEDDLPDWNEQESIPALVPERFDDAHWRRVAAAFAGAAEGLQHAHSRGVLHRDLKPSNLMLDPDGRLRILDFGIAWAEGDPSLTGSRERVGTLLYMSPEQTRGHSRDLGDSTDIYSLGATLYEVLVGRPPFFGRTPSEIVERILTSDPLPPRRLLPEVPRGIELIALKCLRKDPRRRYLTAEALAQDLRRFSRGDPVEAEPETWQEKLIRKIHGSRGRIFRAGAVACAIFTLVAIGWGRYSSWREDRRSAYEAQVERAVLQTLEAQVLAPQSVTATIQGVETSVLGSRDRALKGDRLQAPSNVSFVTGPDLSLAGPLVSGAEDDPLQEAVTLLERAVSVFDDDPVGNYHLARALLFRGDREEAESRLRKVLELDPTFLPARSLLAYVIERTSPGEAESLRREVDRLARTDDRWPLPWLEAQRSVIEKRWEAASAAFDELPKAVGTGEKEYLGYAIETYVTRGVTRLKLGRAVEALADFSAAADKFPLWIEPRLLVAKAYRACGVRDAALREVREVWKEATRNGRVKEDTRGRVARSPDDVALAIAGAFNELEEYSVALEWTNEVSDRAATRRDLLRAEILAHSGDLDKAMRAATGALERGDRTPATFLTLGNVCLLRENAKEAVSWYFRARDAAPADPRPLVALAACAEAMGNLEDARKELESAVRLDHLHAPAHYNLARVLAGLLDLDGALRSALVAVSLSPGDALAWNNLGAIRDKREERQKAKEAYERALELDRDFALAHYNLGWILHRQRLYRKAAEHYERALALGLDVPAAHSHLGACLHHLGRTEEAIAQYRVAIDGGLDDSATWHDLGAVYLATKDHEGAERALRRSIEVGAGGNSYLYLGWTLEDLGRYDEAEATYREGIEAAPDDASLYNDLAWVILRLGRVPAEGDLVHDIRLLERGAQLSSGDRRVAWLLEDYHRAAGPHLVSHGSVDRVFDGPEVLVAEDASWRFRRVSDTAIPDDAWADIDFADAAWEEGPGPFGGAVEPGSGTSIEVAGIPHATVDFRRTFEVRDPRSIRELRIIVRANGGLVVLVNGKEAWRRGLGPIDTPVDPEALDDAEIEAWQPEEAELDPSLLVAGRNAIAVHLVRAPTDDPRVRFRLRLEASPASHDCVLGRVNALAALASESPAGAERADGARGGAATDGFEACEAYFRGRLAEAHDDLDGAARALEEAVSLDPEGIQPLFRLVDILQREGKPSEAELRLRRALETAPPTSSARLWERWIKIVLVDLRVPPGAALDLVRGLVSPEPNGQNYPLDLQWLLDALSRGQPLRINCGGKDCQVDGEAWGRDRFAVAGDESYLDRIDPDAPGIVSPLDLSERYFPGQAPRREGYRIPLPPGNYEVSLRIVEGYWNEPGSRVFDVMLEGLAELPAYEPLSFSGFGIPRVETLCVKVVDGVLDLEFRSLAGDPTVSAVEVRRVEEGASGR